MFLSEMYIALALSLLKERPLEVFFPSLLSSSATSFQFVFESIMPLTDCHKSIKTINSLLFGFSIAVFRLDFAELSDADLMLAKVFRQAPPVFSPRSFFAFSAAFVRWLISSLSYWATLAITPKIRVFSCGTSQKWTCTPVFITLKVNSTSRHILSSFAKTSSHLFSLQKSIACKSPSRVRLFPLSTSLNSVTYSFPDLFI